jgi:SOS response regulatory protein OraA/RecX
MSTPPDTVASEDRPGRRALRILARREVSAARLAEALATQGLGPERVAEELEVVRRLGALDDVRSAGARALALVEKGTHGRRGMHARLVAAGYPAPLVEEVLLSAIEASGWEERTAACTLLSGRPLPDGPRALARLGRLLLARGFDPDIVHGVLPGLEGMEGPG